MKDDTAGDPISGIKWARKAAGKISLQLRQMRIWVSPSTVRRLLKKLDFHLHVNKKTICSTRSADRDLQFKSIRRARNRFERQGLPIISVDTKKREMIGLFKNPGAKWAKTATPVNDHDFLTDAVGVAVSYGIYDPQANRGHIVVGTSRDTSQFAGDALALWWKREGSNRYPDADRLLILADCGGSNSNRVAAWKCAFNTSSATRSASASPSLTIPRVPPSGILSGTASSARSRRTGPHSPSPATRPCSTTYAPPRPSVDSGSGRPYSRGIT